MKPYYQDDFVTLYHGDCREIAPTLGPGFAVVSDPPYGMNWNTDITQFSGGHNASKRLPGRNDNKPVVGDDAPFDPTPWLAYPYCLLWGFNHFPASLAKGTALVWIKRNDDSFGKFLSDAELAWKKGGRGVFCFRDLSMNSITRTRAHPTQKPVDLMTWCLSFIPSTATILDPFAGAGSTLVAAKNIGRKAIGIEIDERHCSTAAQRLSQETLGLVEA